jgi:Cu+-exporting ATPase
MTNRSSSGTHSVPDESVRSERHRWEANVAMVTDPVCGMRIESAEAAGTIDHEGRTFYFCSEACRSAFEADPSSYASGIS